MNNIPLNFTSITGKEFSFDGNPKDSIGQITFKLSNLLKVNPLNLRLIHQNVPISSEVLLESLKLNHDSNTFIYQILSVPKYYSLPEVPSFHSKITDLFTKATKYDEDPIHKFSYLNYSREQRNNVENQSNKPPEYEEYIWDTPVKNVRKH